MRASSRPIQQVSHDDASLLFRIPAELVDLILFFLPAADLAIISSTCRTLRAYASSETHWYRLVQESVPSTILPTPYPYETFRELYIAHYPLWFLPRRKLWFADCDGVGKLVLVRFDRRRGCIEGYQVVATRPPSWDSEEASQGFGEEEDAAKSNQRPELQIRLHLDKPVLEYQATKRAESITTEPSTPNIAVVSTTDGASSVTGSNATGLTEYEFPLAYGGVWKKALMLVRYTEHSSATLVSDTYDPEPWPPYAIPSPHRVGREPVPRPQRKMETSDCLFRIREWMPRISLPPALVTSANHVFSNGLSIQFGREIRQRDDHITTYATLGPHLYTPTKLKPWRGIWVGSRKSHGTDFVLIHQPDDDEDDYDGNDSYGHDENIKKNHHGHGSGSSHDCPLLDMELGLIRQHGEDEDRWQARRNEARVYRGRLEAIRLAVQARPYSFIVDDLSDTRVSRGFTGQAFGGARAVKSRAFEGAPGNGGVGGGGVDGMAVPDQGNCRPGRLLFVGPNKLAHYCLGRSEVEVFERLDIDRLLQQ